MPRYLVVLALLLATCSCSSDPPGAPSTIELGLPTGVTSFANADVVVADKLGYFRDAGISVRVKNLNSGVPVVQGVVGGSLDIGASSIEPVVNAHAQGGGLVVIGSYADRLTVSLVTPREIATPADLRGKRLGVQQVGAFREVMTRMVLTGAQLTPEDVTYVPTDADSYTSALLQGTIQSAVLQQEQVADAQRRDGDLHVLVDLDRVQPDYFYGAYFVTRAWLAENRDTAVKFLTAIVRAHRYMYTDREGTLPVVAEATGFEPQVVGTAYDVLLGQKGVFPVNDGLDPARITSTVRTMEQFKILTGAAPGDDLVDRGPISDVVGTLGEWTGDARWR
ncbi:ABC transporter substrate-binding protein [Amycolatopsis sp. 195334CR]|uniref:ABC transporter substrate-binding protein n=1 Tax=Amycolatopsis sp. 195334CR TaxID=2814588 RepID=UPI001A8E1CE7|nr:ABC transporter substrate-binding protein [Amycolatopsis sp. 195334CR]MBN6040085.1 ABC transporter substrate-binding protein [Amycolatopsis sp. 195334CR]